MEHKSTITMSKKRLIVAFMLCMIAGYPIGYYFGAQDQQASDEKYLMLFAETGSALRIQDNFYSVTKVPLNNISIPDPERWNPWTNQ